MNISKAINIPFQNCPPKAKKGIFHINKASDMTIPNTINAIFKIDAL